MKVDTAPEIVEISREKACSKLSRSSLVVRHALRPLDLLMKAFGMTYGSSCPLITKIGATHKIQRAYTIIVAVILCLATVKYIPIFVTYKGLPTFILIEYFVWHVKCMIQGLYCIFICSRYKRKVSRLQGLIWEYDMLLLSYEHSVRKVEEKFTRRCRIILALLFFVLLFCCGLLVFSFFGPELLPEPSLYPFKPSVFSKIFYMLITAYFTVAWLLPVILYCILCLALCLVFDQFCTSLTSKKCTSV